MSRRIISLVGAAALLLLLAPLFLILALLVKGFMGGPAFYRGTRLGRDKKPFVMYKFRTLPVGAQSQIGARLLPTSHPMITPFGKFLRESRLDELPQLFNVLRGDMDFVGPRPLRPEIYEALCRNIPEYDVRFQVKPGLIGYSQLFTPHSCPKWIRSHLDNRYIRQRHGAFWDMCLLGYTATVVLKLTAFKGFGLFRTHVIQGRILRRFTPQRSLALNRVKQKDLMARIWLLEGSERDLQGAGEVLDIDEKSFLVHTLLRLRAREYLFEFELQIRRGVGKRRLTCRCVGEIAREFHTEVRGKEFFYAVIDYQPTTEMDHYRLEKYVLRKSMV